MKTSMTRLKEAVVMYKASLSMHLPVNHGVQFAFSGIHEKHMAMNTERYIKMLSHIMKRANKKNLFRDRL